MTRGVFNIKPYKNDDSCIRAFLTTGKHRNLLLSKLHALCLVAYVQTYTMYAHFNTIKPETIFRHYIYTAYPGNECALNRIYAKETNRVVVKLINYFEFMNLMGYKCLTSLYY